MEGTTARTEFVLSKTNDENDFKLLVIDNKYEGMLYNCRLIDDLIFVLFIYFPNNFEDRMLFTGSLQELTHCAFVEMVISEIERYKLMNVQLNTVILIK